MPTTSGKGPSATSSIDVDIVFLGTPHHGTPLERYGNWVDNPLEISPCSAPFAKLGKIRSAGITDLRHGNLLDTDRQGRGRFELQSDQRQHVPLSRGGNCYAVAGTRNSSTDRPPEELRGDGMVPVTSALGRPKKRRLNPSFPSSYSRLVSGVKYLDLLESPGVYRFVRARLSA